MTNNNQKKSLIYALMSVLLWSTVASAFKLALEKLTVIELLLIANTTSVVVLFFIAVVSRSFIHLRDFSKIDFLYSAFFGLLNPFLYYLILFSAYDLLPAQQAQTINYTWGIVLPLFAVPILKQKLYRSDVLGLIVAYVGVVIISSGGDFSGFSQSSSQGVIYALLSTFIWALYWVLNTKRTKDQICSLLLNFSFGLVFIAVYYFLFAEVKTINSEGYLSAIYVGVFEMSLTFYLWLKALRLSNRTAKISTLIFLSPFLSLVFIYFILGEPIKLSTIAGLFIIISGLFIQQKFRIEGS